MKFLEFIAFIRSVGVKMTSNHHPKGKTIREANMQSYTNSSRSAVDTQTIRSAAVNVCTNNKNYSMWRFRAQINHEQRVDRQIDIIIKSVCWTLHFIFTGTRNVSGKIHHGRPSRRTLHNSPYLSCQIKAETFALFVRIIHVHVVT